MLFPTPGEPVIPIRIDLPVFGKIFFRISCAWLICAGELLSVRVIALAKMLRLSLRIPVI